MTPSHSDFLAKIVVDVLGEDKPFVLDVGGHWRAPDLGDGSPHDIISIQLDAVSARVGLSPSDGPSGVAKAKAAARWLAQFDDFKDLKIIVPPAEKTEEGVVY